MNFLSFLSRTRHSLWSLEEARLLPFLGVDEINKGNPSGGLHTFRLSNAQPSLIRCLSMLYFSAYFQLPTSTDGHDETWHQILSISRTHFCSSLSNLMQPLHL